MDKCHIDGFSNLPHVEYANGFPLRELFLNDNQVFCTLLTRRNGLKHVVFTSILCRKRDCSSKIILIEKTICKFNMGKD